MLGLQRIPTSHPSPKLSTKARNDQKWENHKDCIRNVYINRDHTLKETMKVIEDTYNFTASARKWKQKLKEWKFEKNVPATYMSIIIAKRENRKRKEGKDTKFFYGGAEIKSEKFENFNKRKTTKAMDVVPPTVATPEDITYYTPSPQALFTPPDVENNLALDPQVVNIEHIDYLTITDDILDPRASSKGTSNKSGNIVEEILTFLPDPSHQHGERHMLIETISPSSMLWNCSGRGLHTIDEESVIGLDDEILAPSVALDLIKNHICGARVDFENYRAKAAIIKYLGAIILAIERKCCSEETLFEYCSEFLDLLEVGPGVFVSALRQSPHKPIFQIPKDSDVFLLYHELSALLQSEFQQTTEVVTRICVLLADLETLYPEMSYRAETLYKVAISGYEEVGKFDHLFQCQLSLADLLIDLNRPSEAYELLALACGKYLNNYLDLWVNEKPTTTCYILASLFPVSPGVRPSIFRIKHIVSQRLEIPPGGSDNYELYVMMIHEIAALGGILSVEAGLNNFVIYVEALNSFWSELFGKLSSLDDVAFASLKAFAYIQHSYYLPNGFNLFSHPNCLDDITTAHQYLIGRGHLRQDLKVQLIQHVEYLRSRILNEQQTQIQGLFSLEFEIQSMFSLEVEILKISPGISRDSSNISHSSPLGTLQLQSSLPEDMKDTGDIFESSTTKRKYGVTFIDSMRAGLCFTD
ncbi:hypothetical protein BGZ60DRAFT_512441 [Tricladium varicosporioides]|nr:hypothetical protein BGZ60DRAFT_512441 [Hymenoscyphus varicosporioides]